jgi:phage shock protein PspC (stress-responsive transcriptional regulator)
MKEVYDISLRGISFKIEKDAYDLLDNYLVELKGHYGEQEAEVVNDIEERIAELLLEKGCANSTVVQYYHIDDIIRTLGRPSEIEDSSGEKAVKVKKGIFRDTRNGVVAGVCSGLGAYFNLDAVWVRVIFILLAVVFTAPSLFIRNFLGLDMGWFGFLLLVYCILWLIIPEARTVSQRCAMRGESQSVDHIHRKFAQGAREVGNEMWQVGSQATGTVFSTIWRVICFTAGVLLTVAGFAGIVTVGVGFIGVDMIAGISALSIPDFIELNIGSTLWLKIFGVLAVMLPCVGMLYWGMKLCFNFKAPKWRPGMIIFIVWLVSLIVFVLFVVKSITPYQDLNKLDKEEIAAVGNYDTLYVVCPKVPGIQEAKMNIEAHRNSLELFYMNNSHKKDASFTVYPRFSVKRVKEGAPKLEANMTSFSQLPSMEGIVQVKDSLITLLPAVYSKENKFAGEVQYIKLFVPDSTTVILKEPIDFTFGESKSYRAGLKR